jgi:PAS domain S-box-containing protein
MGDLRSRSTWTEKRGPAVPPPKPSVLIVDDRPANLFALEVLIQDLGYCAVLANSGSEALKQLLEKEFACVLLDLRMPGIDGLETAALIRKRERHKDLPILFITSTEANLTELSQGYSLGAVDFIQRPLDSEILKSKIRAVVRLYERRGHAPLEKDEELRRGRQRLDLLFDQLPVALWSTDEDLFVTFCGGSLYGQGDVPPPDALVGKRLTELLPAMDGKEHPTVIAHRKALLGEKQSYAEERLGRTFEGVLRPLQDDQGRVTGVLGAAIDTTDRRRTEEALREGREQFELLMGGINDYAIIFLDPEGTITGWNVGAERIKGYSSVEAIGMPYARFFVAEELSSEEKAGRLLAEAARTGSVRDQGWRVRKDGSRFWADVLLAARRQPNGKLRGFVKITRDLTERHEAEEKLKLLNENLEQVVEKRTAELQTMVDDLKSFNHTVAHDLRAPLRVSIALSQVLLEEYEDKALDADGRDYLKRILNSGRRMDQLIQDLLAYAEISRRDLVLREIDLPSLLKETLTEMAGETEARHAVISQGKLPKSAKGDAVTIKHILTNLILNGIKFSRQGAHPQLRIAGEDRGRFVRLWVEDNGIGVAPENHDKIFRIFERLHTQEEYPGTGIGLAIVSRSVERLGGRVGVVSELGHGSRFWFELPKS